MNNIMRPYTLDEIKSRLKELGAKNEELESVIFDVNKIALGKLSVMYFSRLPDNLREEIQRLSTENLFGYIRSHKDHFVDFSVVDIEKTFRDVWDDYFAYMSK